MIGNNVTLDASGFVQANNKKEITDERIETFLWRLLILTALFYLVWEGNVKVNLGLLSLEKTEDQIRMSQFSGTKFSLLGLFDESAIRLSKSGKDQGNLAFVFYPELLQSESLFHADAEIQLEQCQAFIHVAIAEKRRFGVPASILMAQALLESNAGMDSLADKTNNFFLRPCFDATCNVAHAHTQGLHIKAPVHAYTNQWQSFRDQSMFYQSSPEFQGLLNNSNLNPDDWIKLLERTGYSPDTYYGKKLHLLIQKFQLYKFDNR